MTDPSPVAAAPRLVPEPADRGALARIERRLRAVERRLWSVQGEHPSTLRSDPARPSASEHLDTLLGGGWRATREQTSRSARG